MMQWEGGYQSPGSNRGEGSYCVFLAYLIPGTGLGTLPGATYTSFLTFLEIVTMISALQVKG